MLHALATLQLSIPGDVAIIGFDDLQMFDIFMPPVTVIRQPVEDLGRTAAEMLLKHLKSEASTNIVATTANNVLLPVELVVRRSCGCA